MAVVTISIPDELKAEIDQEAKMLRVNRSALIRWKLEQLKEKESK